jgi:hypothetical protein
MSFRNDQSATIGFIAAGLGGLILALGGAAYAWDGAFFLEEIINRGAPFAPQHRWSDYVWEAPTWAAIRLTDNAALAQWTFRVSTGLLPLTALVASWLIVRRKRPDLIVWPIIGICGCSLPGEWFSVAEGIIAIQFAWPLFLAIAVGLEGGTEIAAAVLAAFIFFEHPFAFPIFVGGALALLAGQSFKLLPPSPRWRWWVGALLAAGIVRRVLLASSEQGYTTLAWLRQSTVESMYHLPLLAMAVLLIAAVTMCFPRTRPLVPGALIICSTLMLCVHFLQVTHWTLALSYRLPVLFVTAPFVLLMFVAGAIPPLRPSVTVAAATATGIMFVAVLLVQSFAWHHVLSDVRASTRSGASCKTLARVDKGRGTPITHWATSYLAILEQGRHPSRFLTGSVAECRTFDRTGRLHLRPWDPSFAEPSGYYRLSRAARGNAHPAR